ncbi:carotenoid biosynthesis protein [uncultured Microscilla sp.]|uniref:carotenoid biosynthesis protein n=1 Tax=uncultured Microscilla sp. TaxID=432653 RepID=UPI002614AD8D|nr:carotenoid biosynthesis protein [uncultured Microscilla sp.]
MERWSLHNKKQKQAAFLLVIVHLAGAIGFHSPFAAYFIALTPLNLLLSAFVLLSAHRDYQPSFWWFCAVCFATGLIVELVGVQTGLLFGNYSYGATLGFKIWGTPVIIGVNWLILVYSSGVVTHQLKLPIVVKSALAAAIMVGLDYLIEPVAMRYDFWGWQNDIIPLQNYVMWYIVAFALLMLFHRLKFDKNNPLAAVLLAVQFAFFGALNIF